MPDLIIKPQTGSGNSVILQDQAGGAVLTSADSGSDYVGTTKGTIHSTATFPAGHVIQCRAYESGTQTALTSASFNTGDVVGDWQFTPLLASSNILLTGYIVLAPVASSTYLFVDFYKNASDVTETANLSAATTGCAMMGEGDKWSTQCWTFMDTCAENSLSEKTYKLSGRQGTATGTSYLGWGVNIPARLIIQEITT